MPARAKQLDGRNSRARRFAQQSSCQLPVYKKICGENAFDRHNVRALFIGMISTLCEAVCSSQGWNALHNLPKDRASEEVGYNNRLQHL